LGPYWRLDRQKLARGCTEEIDEATGCGGGILGRSLTSQLFVDFSPNFNIGLVGSVDRSTEIGSGD
jgi:hypothetical protein